MFKKNLTVLSIMNAATADLETVQEQQQAIADNADRIIKEQEAIEKAALVEVKTANKAIGNFRKLFS